MNCDNCQPDGVCSGCGSSAESAREYARFCPYCGGKNIAFLDIVWKARSQDPTDASNTADLDEYQCLDCDCRSFWT